MHSQLSQIEVSIKLCLNFQKSICSQWTCRELKLLKRISWTLLSRDVRQHNIATACDKKFETLWSLYIPCILTTITGFESYADWLNVALQTFLVPSPKNSIKTANESNSDSNIFDYFQYSSVSQKCYNRI